MNYISILKKPHCKLKVKHVHHNQYLGLDKYEVIYVHQDEQEHEEKY